MAAGWSAPAASGGARGRGPIRRPALVDGLRVLPLARPRSDALLVPVVLAVMHSAFGVGTLVGSARHGIPAAALASAVGLPGLAESLAPAPEPVFAPSLALNGCRRATMPGQP